MQEFNAFCIDATSIGFILISLFQVFAVSNTQGASVKSANDGMNCNPNFQSGSNQ